jgi:hypothetical protein
MPFSALTSRPGIAIVARTRERTDLCRRSTDFSAPLLAFRASRRLSVKSAFDMGFFDLNCREGFV